MSNHKISVILPVRNGMDFIENCIHSYLDQKIDNCSKELIIVNDNSSDSTEELGLQYSNKYDEVMYVRNPNKGVIEALKFGLEKASGNYISRMDVDDIMPKNKLQILKRILEEKSADVATGKVKYFHNSKEHVGDGYLKYENWLNNIIDDQSYYAEMYKECVVASPNWLMRKRDLERVGGFHGIYPEDYDLVFRFYAHKLRIIGSAEVTHHWFDHEERTSRNSDLYKENNFFELKLKYFFELDYNADKGLTVYGAGNKGKYLARNIIERGVDLVWCTNNPKKVGKQIYGVQLISDADPIESMGRQIIIAIAIEEDQKLIEERLVNSGLVRGSDYFFFA